MRWYHPYLVPRHEQPIIRRAGGTYQTGRVVARLQFKHFNRFGGGNKQLQTGMMLDYIPPGEERKHHRYEEEEEEENLFCVSPVFSAG